MHPLKKPPYKATTSPLPEGKFPQNNDIKNDSHLIAMGRIGAPHGVKGWLKIVSFTDPIENILQYQPWYLRQAGQLKKIVISNSQIFQNKIIIAQLNDLTDRDIAAQLTGSEILVERQQLPKLPPQEYYWADLEGLQVITNGDHLLGSVTQLLPTGSNDVLVVVGEKRHLIPFLLNDVIISVDLENKVIRVNWDPEF